MFTISVECQAIAPRDPAEETPTILHVARLVEVKGRRISDPRLRPAGVKAPTVEIGDYRDGR